MIIKVNRERLIRAITSKRDEVVKAHAAKVRESGQAFEGYKQHVLKIAHVFEVRARGAKTARMITDALRYGNELKFPDAPDVPREPKTADYDAALAKLALSDEVVIQLNEKSDRTFLDLL